MSEHRKHEIEVSESVDWDYHGGPRLTDSESVYARLAAKSAKYAEAKRDNAPAKKALDVSSHTVIQSTQTQQAVRTTDAEAVGDLVGLFGISALIWAAIIAMRRKGTR